MVRDKYTQIITPTTYYLLPTTLLLGPTPLIKSLTNVLKKALRKLTGCGMTNMTLPNTMQLAVPTISSYRTEPD